MRTYEYMVRALARASYLNTAMKILRQMRGIALFHSLFPVGPRPLTCMLRFSLRTWLHPSRSRGQSAHAAHPGNQQHVPPQAKFDVS